MKHVKDIIASVCIVLVTLSVSRVVYHHVHDIPSHIKSHEEFQEGGTLAYLLYTHFTTVHYASHELPHRNFGRQWEIMTNDEKGAVILTSLVNTFLLLLSFVLLDGWKFIRYRYD